MIEFETFLEQILEGYRSSYDVERIEDGGMLVATAHLHMSQGQHVALKEIEMWSADFDEYVYIYRIPHLTVEQAQKAIQESYDDGFPRIKLEHVSFRHQHMCTRLVALVIYDDSEEEALKVLRKCKIYQSFQFSLKGWMEVHTAAVCLNEGEIVSNRYGRETAKFLKIHVDHYLQHVKPKQII